MTQRKPLLLIADDDPEILSLLSLRFTKKGYDVIEATNGDDTLREARERRPDALILDVMMPGKNGWEVARELRADPSLTAVGIVMLTAMGERVNEMTSALYGADEAVDKPFEFADLDAQIVAVLEKRRSTA